MGSYENTGLEMHATVKDGNWKRYIVYGFIRSVLQDQ